MRPGRIWNRESALETSASRMHRLPVSAHLDKHPMDHWRRLLSSVAMMVLAVPGSAQAQYSPAESGVHARLDTVKDAGHPRPDSTLMARAQDGSRSVAGRAAEWTEIGCRHLEEECCQWWLRRSWAVRAGNTRRPRPRAGSGRGKSPQLATRSGPQRSDGR